MKTALLAALIWLAAVSQGFAQSVANDIDRANARFEKAFNSGDAAAVAQFYTENATVLPPDGDMVTGRDAIQKLWQGAIQSGLKNISLKAVRVDALGNDAAREIGRFTLDVPGPQGRMSTIEGKYVVVWLKTNGEWKLDTDIWNTNKPPEPMSGTGATK